MKTYTKTVIAGIVAILLLIAACVFFTQAYGNAAEANVRTTVNAFASQLQKVSLLAPNAGAIIEKAYAPYVDASLLSTWQQNPSSAPGRQTSSPWPDHIVITRVQGTAHGAYIVSGTLVLMTSNEAEHGGNAGTAPVSITLRKENGEWKIVQYSQGAYMGPNGTELDMASTTSPAMVTTTQNTEQVSEPPVLATSTQASSTPVTTALHIATIAPSSGDAGTRIIMTGSGFDSGSQIILENGRGAIPNVKANENGTVLTFIMPSSVGAYCAPGHACPMYALLLKPGVYDLAVRNTDGATSNSVQFTLIGTSVNR